MALEAAEAMTRLCLSTMSSQASCCAMETMAETYPSMVSLEISAPSRPFCLEPLSLMYSESMERVCELYAEVRRSPA